MEDHVLDLSKIEPKVLGMSQKGQDSYIDHIFYLLGETNRYYVEFGAVDGITSSNTFYLREHKRWKGLLLDNEYENRDINLFKVHITKENILDIFKEHNVPKELDFLSIDIDGNDYWILKSILQEYSPRVIMIEANIRFSPDESIVQKYDPSYRWSGRDWCGASPAAIKNLCKDYSVVHIHLDDMLLVHNDALRVFNYKTKSLEELYKPNMELYASHNSRELDRSKWIEV